MKLASALLREKTNVGVKGATTFNAPGQYLPPYGKTTVRIGGRGASGNYSSGGNYAGEGYAGESYAGSNPGYSYRNSPEESCTYSPSVYFPANYFSNGEWSGDSYYWPGGYSCTSTPGNSVTVPGNAYYSPYYTAYYNPYYPGSAGTPSNIGGVYFPAGNSDSLAVVVPSTTSNMTSTPGGYLISVPPGGYVTIQNV